MTTIFNKKPVQMLLLALMAFETACSEVSTSSDKGTNEDGGDKLAYILEKTATPTKWDPEGAQIENFKHCVQWSKGNEVTVKATYEMHVENIKFDEETLADAKANNYKISTPPIQIHSVSLAKICPTGAIATCDKGNAVEHYYTGAEWVLAGFEKSCGHSGSDVWTKSQ